MAFGQWRVVLLVLVTCGNGVQARRLRVQAKTSWQRILRGSHSLQAPAPAVAAVPAPAPAVVVAASPSAALLPPIDDPNDDEDPGGPGAELAEAVAKDSSVMSQGVEKLGGEAHEILETVDKLEHWHKRTPVLEAAGKEFIESSKASLHELAKAVGMEDPGEVPEEAITEICREAIKHVPACYDAVKPCLEGDKEACAKVEEKGAPKACSEHGAIMYACSHDERAPDPCADAIKGVPACLSCEGVAACLEGDMEACDKMPTTPPEPCQTPMIMGACAGGLEEHVMAGGEEDEAPRGEEFMAPAPAIPASPA